MKIKADELRSMSNKVNLDKINPLYESILLECEKVTEQGNYSYVHYFNKGTTNDDAYNLQSVLEANGFKVYLQTQYEIKFTPKWYQFGKKEEKEANIIMIVDWRN